MNKEIIEKILEAANRAPSGDNVQPWKFQVSENFTRIDLYNLPEKDESFYNFEQVASYIAHGAVLENVLIAARFLGANVEYKLFPDSSNPNLVAQIELSSAPSVVDPLYPAIFNRRTNRFPFRRVKLTEGAIVKLSNTVKNIDNIKISLVHQRDRINALAKILMINDRLVFEREDIHSFLFDKIRWNQRQVDETLDGMPVESLGLNFIDKLLFPLMRFWVFVKTSNYFGLSRLIALKCWWNCRNASILGMLSAQGNDKIAFVQGGRGMQRLWLEATLQNLEFQPIIGLTLLIYRLNKDELQEFSSKHRQMVEKAARNLTGQFALTESDTMIMGFRLGQGRPVDVKTKRRKLEY